MPPYAPNKGKGATVQWIRAHVSYEGEWCLIWPFATNSGYGHFNYEGKMHYAHRYMCELVNGPCPSDDHEAAHTCGRGNRGCVNPKHIVWKTRSENQMDRIAHGTDGPGPRGKLTAEEADQIRALKGILSQSEIARRFGVSRSNVSFIHCGKLWSKPPRGVTWRPERSKWRARLSGRGGKRILGYFDTEADAIAAYEAAARP